MSDRDDCVNVLVFRNAYAFPHRLVALERGGRKTNQTGPKSHGMGGKQNVLRGQQSIFSWCCPPRLRTYQQNRWCIEKEPISLVSFPLIEGLRDR